MMAERKKCEYEDLLTLYLNNVLKIEDHLKYIKESMKDFPYDYRYILLKEDINEEVRMKILKLYTDEELDMLFYTLESNIYKTTSESMQREENEIFNLDNDKKVLKNCTLEYKNRNLI